MTVKPLALITGASKGIGTEVARLLAPTHRLLLGGRDADALSKLTEELPGSTPWQVELTDADAVASAVADIDRLDVLVHSAGVADIAPIAQTPPAVWRRMYEVNVVAVAELTRLLLPALRTTAGQVILLNSGSGLRVNPRWGAYAASKFALRAFADALRAEEEPNGVRVTSVHPGRTVTDMQRAVREAEGGNFEVNRYLRPESVAAAVLAAVNAPADAHLTEIVIRPRPRR
jgi:NADP-dependent 3-hydroxy acid dehydrogenase YdfG